MVEQSIDDLPALDKMNHFVQSLKPPPATARVPARSTPQSFGHKDEVARSRLPLYGWPQGG